MKLVYTCSPFAGDIDRNQQFARTACRYAINQGCAPIAVHLLYPQILNDNVHVEREAGMQMGLRVLASCDEVWVCGERISYGMKCEITEAERLGIPIRNISTEQIRRNQHEAIWYLGKKKCRVSLWGGRGLAEK